ncbi:hypothetical protein [Methylococcus mesophilus]|uniref:hypothetical protein n=1 Tax=Methylococcus mesophilus TaxID=2993564 RepID=UPI00224B1293|nr:hypothetical protein [Methylococcus mesophilus]UZR29041.1 hypothetical protein OOT43_00005 [Methylococcus mesophilus]
MDIILDSHYSDLLIQDVDAAFVDKLMAASRVRRDYKLQAYVRNEDESAQDITVVRPGTVLNAKQAEALQIEKESAALAAAEAQASPAEPDAREAPVLLQYDPELEEVAL